MFSNFHGQKDKQNVCTKVLLDIKIEKTVNFGFKNFSSLGQNWLHWNSQIYLEMCLHNIFGCSWSPIDILMKDLMLSQFWFSLLTGLFQFISIFTPPLVPLTDNVYIISHTCVFVANFHCISIFVFLYVQHIYVFQPDSFTGADVSTIRYHP